MTSGRRSARRDGGAGRPSVTIKDLAADLGLSITTISRALNGYPDVGEKTRQRVIEAARRRGYRPNRNAQRLVTQRTHNIAWVQSDNERKFVDPHFVEVMAGVLRAARSGEYDIVMSSETPERQVAAHDRYVKENSVDGFVVDLPTPRDPRITFLLEAGKPFVVHGRDGRQDRYGWVDIDNYGNFYRFARLMVANGHKRFALINGDERFTFAIERRRGVSDALRDLGMPPETVRFLSAVHPMGDAGFQLTRKALEEPELTAIVYSSALMAVEGYSAIMAAGREPGRDISVASMDDELHYLDLARFRDRFSFVRSSLRDAGVALMQELIRQCDHRAAPSGTLIPSSFHLAPDLDPAALEAPLPERVE